jgi:glycosyltransferase involved in cell wall biosynthesis
MNGSFPLVSVVTPVYNGEEYLRECIESVLAQSHQNWEYIIVNNCSTDRTLEIAREYADREPRIRIRSNETFVGVIQNHNIAFREISAASRYCKVVAADDWIFPRCLEEMVRLAEEHDSVAIVGALQLWGTKVTLDGLPYSRTVIPGREMCRMQLLGGPYLFGTPTNVLYRSSLVRRRHAFYNEANLHADDEACVECLDGQDFGFVHQVLTFRRAQEGTLTSFSQRFNTYAHGLMTLVVRHGPKYLTAEERQTRLEEVRRDYYTGLARLLFKKSQTGLWKYHREQLRDLGYPFSAARLSAAAGGLLLDRLFNPKSTIEKIGAALRRGPAADSKLPG